MLKKPWNYLGSLLLIKGGFMGCICSCLLLPMLTKMGQYVASGSLKYWYICSAASFKYIYEYIAAKLEEFVG